MRENLSEKIVNERAKKKKSKLPRESIQKNAFFSLSLVCFSFVVNERPPSHHKGVLRAGRSERRHGGAGAVSGFRSSFFLDENDGRPKKIGLSRTNFPIAAPPGTRFLLPAEPGLSLTARLRRTLEGKRPRIALPGRGKGAITFLRRRPFDGH